MSIYPTKSQEKRIKKILRESSEIFKRSYHRKRHGRMVKGIIFGKMSENPDPKEEYERTY